MNNVQVIRNQHLKQVFLQASELRGPLRERYLAQTCGRDPHLWSDVRELLSIHERPYLALDESPLSALALPAPEPPPRHQPRYQPGHLLAGRYRVTRFLAAGGMGEVYAVRDEIHPDGPELALKFVRPPLSPADGEQLQARFQREVRLARRIVHENVCRVHSLEWQGPEAFCVMDLLEGQTLSARLRHGPPLTPDEALPLVRDLCAGLAAAHDAGVLHRDLKPANIFLASSPGRPPRAVIIDFGLAAARTPGQTLTADGVLIGTLAYMAPEQLEEGRASVQADLYSLGAVIFEMLTGRKHVESASPLRLAFRAAKSSRHTPHFGDRHIPPFWRELVLRCLKADPRQRFRTAEELRRFVASGQPSLPFRLTNAPFMMGLAAGLALLLAWQTFNFLRADFDPPAAAHAEYAQALAAWPAAPERAAARLARATALAPGYLHAHALLAITHFENHQADRAREVLLAAWSARGSRWFAGRRESLSLAAAHAALTRDFAAAAQAYRSLAALTTNAQERAVAQVLAARMAARAQVPPAP